MRRLIRLPFLFAVVLSLNVVTGCERIELPEETGEGDEVVEVPDDTDTPVTPDDSETTDTLTISEAFQVTAGRVCVKGYIVGYVSGSTALEDENPEDNRVSFLWQRGPSTFLKSGTQSLIGCEISLRPTWLTRGGSRGVIADFRGDQRTFTVQLPEKDSGWTYHLGLPFQVDEETMTLEELYISPIGVACSISGTPNDSRMWGPPGLSGIYDSLVLNMANGDLVAMSQSVRQTYNPETGEGRLVFQTERIIEPENVLSVTLLGQTFSLDDLQPVTG